MGLVKRKILNFLGNFSNYDTYKSRRLWKRSPYYQSPDAVGRDFGSKFKVLIAKDIFYEHDNFISACQDEKISYEVHDLLSNKWIHIVQRVNPSAVLIWPSINSLISKFVWDQRIEFLNKVLKVRTIPSFEEFNIYESKMKTRDFLVYNDVPHPKTYIFFNKEAADEFASSCKYPLVYKTDQGASASGVRICYSQYGAKTLITKAFLKGVKLKNGNPYNTHRDYVIFQEYLEDCKEWRIIRINDSFFCRLKHKIGEFHSGSDEIVWANPPTELLDTTKELSDRFNWTQVNIDFFEANDGRFLVNEIHALFGGKAIEDPELNGRFVYDNQLSQWRFQKGDFFKNRTANLRIQNLLKEFKNSDHGES